MEKRRERNEGEGEEKTGMEGEWAVARWEEKGRTQKQIQRQGEGEKERSI